MALVVSRLPCLYDLDDLRALRANEGLGFFPVGASGMWHGGIHLQAPYDQAPVGAVADGVLLACRITHK
jgi:hypothetical protein